MSIELIRGDCLEVMRGMEPESVDTVITDSPYGLSFMGKEWDRGVPGIPFWAEMLRVAKPGAFLLAMGGTRTHHRLMCAIEDAGWEIRDCMMWVYGSGFPKSHNISKAIDKIAIVTCRECDGSGVMVEVTETGAAGDEYNCPYCDGRGWMHGAEREVVGTVRRWGANAGKGRGNQHANGYEPSVLGAEKFDDITAPATPDAELWDGYGTALKPAWEPIIVAMKPLDGTFAENALRHGVAGLNIDGARVGTEDTRAPAYRMTSKNLQGGGFATGKMDYARDGSVAGSACGRWPANLIHDGSDEVVGLFPVTKSGARTGPNKTHSLNGDIYGKYAYTGGPCEASTGSAARFFYTAKSSASEREAGLIGHIPCHKCGGLDTKTHIDERGNEVKCRRNTHPTCKPVSLIEYLCTLTKTPTGGVVLDPFAGSGTTMVACVNTGRDGIGIDISGEYIDIAERRVAEAQMQPRLM